MIFYNSTISINFSMYALFKNSLKSIIQLLRLENAGMVNVGSKAVEGAIEQVLRHDITYSKLGRLPTSEVKTMLKVPCPIDGEKTAGEQGE
jgi:hypothetical protein